MHPPPEPSSQIVLKQKTVNPPMSHSKPQICCPNPACDAPLNPLGRVVCDACGTPLIYRYLWAVGRVVEQIPLGSQVGGRYYVTARRIWLDTQPSLPPDVPLDWSDDVTPYLSLYPYRLHIPEVYGFWLENGDTVTDPVFLLENVPLDGSGLLHPAIAEAWFQATAVRQVYWLWQLLQLWTPLAEQGVVASLLATDNIRVEGWRVRLCQLYHDGEIVSGGERSEADALSLADLANVWLGWVETARPEVIDPLRSICRQMQVEGITVPAIAAELNELLLKQAAKLPLRLEVVGATTTGPERSHNEDACYPLTLNQSVQADGLMPYVAIVCDGIGGHEGGEVASQLAVQTLKLQAQALLAEVNEQTEPVMPNLLAQQLEAAVRVVNNMVADQNNAQGREDRRRMGTTLVMAIQVPQRVETTDGLGTNNGHELYLVNVGDSRAYWITPRYCHQLTVDDDVAVREVRMARALYREAIHRPDAGALTQAIGTRSGDFIHPSVQRFILEEDGLLLLCSDGVSDNGLVEQSWAEVTKGVFAGKRSLAATVQNWLDLSNHHNGHDNATMVLLHCHVSLAMPNVTAAGYPAGAEWSPASQALLQDEAMGTEQRVQPIPPSLATNGLKRWLPVSLLALVLLGGGLGLFAWSQLSSQSFQQFWQKVIPGAVGDRN